MKRWWLLIALLLSLGANIGILASRAFPPRPAPADVTAVSPQSVAPRDDRLPRVMQRMANELGLEGEKRANFMEIQRTFFEETLAARSRMASLQSEVRREVTAEEPDRQALDAILVDLSAAHTDLERAFVNNLLDSREILDPDQERRFMRFLGRMRHVRADVERRFRQRWRGRMEPRRRLGPGGLERPPRRFEEPPPGGSPQDSP